MTTFNKYKFTRTNSSLERVLEKSYKINETIKLMNKFIETSKLELKGKGYDALRKMLSYQIEYLTYLSKLYLLAYEYIKNANNQIVEFMEGYDIFNDLELENVKNRYNHIYADYYELKDNKFAEVFNVWTIRGYERTLSNLDVLMNKLEQVKSVDTNATNSFSDLISTIEKYKNRIENLPVLYIE